uniref:testis-specific Y-encoded protein 4-like n=1 Tax=Halichoerus grypus TaxID=9711 RepID=UPI0016598F95|nr:testis-specific Y-encoded protein 4-like [Halichoerus grypus]
MYGCAGDLVLVLQLAVLEGEDEEDTEEDTEEEDEAREVEESEEEGEEDGEEEVAEDEAWTEAEEVTNEDREENGEKEEAEEADKAKAEEQPEARQAPSLSSLEALEALQSELEPVNKQASRSYSRLKLRFHQSWQCHLEHRSTLIRGITGFWAKAFVNNPQMLAMIREQDEGLLGYMTDLKMEELSFPHDCLKILLFFRKNHYFRNEVVVKEYVLSAAGYGPSHSTPIQWQQNYEREAYSRRHHNTSPNFFNWFSDHSFAGSSRIAEIILDDMWPNPLQYYVRKKAPGGGTKRRTGKVKILR